ncbi:integral membrane protein [Purpureocillium lilacinum]|uniref:Integral membrane protein n=1 Tax=Purpureocillium lilacinum TaxID=33203 RepID=A0A179GVU9_PURLI|nr:integral membrane protein [Purpureocillium lilacinum]KAK4086629.1 hypothetical protein Purlil1_9019 [Purpureocillium lilacinum]OAQ81618.1 integral membrane protein [Purpureocillium lilacinum]OAQ91669.1 integral membrane protein [Purpureocillium lilacinum]PWI65160.1 hypothetical protein PCL_07337 [Purpureocillium lilacinum]GJN73019.1 hypothetical protein PLICBS_007095 [Purpureocillium lilacinum]
MPLFSRKQGDDEERREGQNRPRADDDDDAEQPPPDEHTRLLPNRVDSTPPRGMLTPDDPAVSPYNLWSIRILRYLTLLFTAVTFAWWVVLLVSTFATPPGLHTRGSGFFAFSYTSLALASLLFTLVFFGVPSKAVRILAIVMAFFLLLDMILLLCVQQTRYEEGWVGIVSVVWVLLMSLWTLLTDRAVKWGKEEEEERLTGRAETRRTLTEWLAVLLSTIGYSVMVVAVVLITLTIILRALDAGVAPPGKLYQVDNGKYRIHLYCHGNETDADGHKTPTVLFEAGERPFEEQLWGFADNAIKNGSISRYCFADRPGIAWSDTAPSPLSAGFAVDVLSEALAEAGEQGPWILASAGIGSIYSRVFSSRHGHDVKGLLLIDPLHEDFLGAVARPGRGFLLWLRGIISPLGLDRLTGAIFRGRTNRDRIYGRASQQRGKFIFAQLQESLVADSFTKRDVRSSRQIQERDKPLVVISSGKEVKRSKAWEEKQRDLTELTDELRHWDIVNGAPHRVWETLDGRQQIEKRLRQLVQDE